MDSKPSIAMAAAAVDQPMAMETTQALELLAKG
jgi:hypothetical protein